MTSTSQKPYKYETGDVGTAANLNDDNRNSGPKEEGRMGDSDALVVSVADDDIRRA